MSSETVKFRATLAKSNSIKARSSQRSRILIPAPPHFLRKTKLYISQIPKTGLYLAKQRLIKLPILKKHAIEARTI